MGYYISWRGEGYADHKRTFNRLHDAISFMDRVIERLAREGFNEEEEVILQMAEIRSLPACLPDRAEVVAKESDHA